MANLQHPGIKNQEELFTIATAQKSNEAERARLAEQLPTLSSGGQKIASQGLGDILNKNVKPPTPSGNVNLSQAIARELVQGGEQAREQLKILVAEGQVSSEEAQIGIELALQASQA